MICFPESSRPAWYCSSLAGVRPAWQQTGHRLAQLRLHNHGPEPRPGTPAGPDGQVVGAGSATANWSFLVISPGSVFIFWPFCRYEHFFGPLASHHLCVTNAMKEDLKKTWGIRWEGFTDRLHFFLCWVTTECLCFKCLISVSESVNSVS